MEFLENKNITYLSEFEFIKNKINNLYLKYKKIYKTLKKFSAQDDLYIELLNQEIYILSEEIERLKQLKKDKFLEICN